MRAPQGLSAMFRAGTFGPSAASERERVLSSLACLARRQSMRASSKAVAVIPEVTATPPRYASAKVPCPRSVLKKAATATAMPIDAPMRWPVWSRPPRAAALRRGYNVLAYDGPGQGAVLRQQQLVFRPDWEAVITPVIDYAAARPEIDAGQIVLFGYSMGSHLVARAAAFDRRVAALILDDGIYDLHTAFTRPLPPFLASWVADGRDEQAIPGPVPAHDRQYLTAVAMNNGVWAFGASSFADLIRKAGDYTLDGYTSQITVPTVDHGRGERSVPQGRAASAAQGPREG